MPAPTKVCDDHFHFDGVDYFRGRAAAVCLGDVGAMRRPAGGPSHLDVRGALPRESLSVARVSRIDLDGLAVRGSDIASDVTVAEIGALGPSTVARQLQDRTLCLVKIEAAIDGVIAAANACAGARKALCSAGASGRLVHQVFVVLETAPARELARATRWWVREAAGACVLTGFHAEGGRSAVELRPGATFAYLLLAPIRAGRHIAAAAPDPWSES